MGKPSISCLKIIGCGGGDGVDDDDDGLLPEEAKVSSDKRRWSFRKRSSRNQVLNNSVTSDPMPVCSSKPTEDILTNSLQSSKYSLPEKPQIKETPIEESPLPSNIVNTEAAPSLSDKSISSASTVTNEHDIVIIQTAIRGYLARYTLHKLKSIVKLQAAVRGLLVRRQAIGTLRCIQAIIRTQAFVRAKRARQLVGNLSSSEETKFQVVKSRSIKASPETIQEISVPGLLVRRQAIGTLRCIQAIISTQALKRAKRARQLGKGDSFEKRSKTSIKNLLSNRLARQLLETAPTRKTMYIKCDPLKSDSAWKWLEIWMSVTSAGAGHRPEQNFNQDGWELEDDAQKTDTEQTMEIPCAVTLSSDLKTASTESVSTGVGKNSVTTESIGDIHIQTSVASDNSFESSLKDDEKDLELENEGLDTITEDNTESEMIKDSLVSKTDDTALLQNANSETLVGYEPDGTECAKDTSDHSNCNPASPAAQAKSEELSSIAIIGRSAGTINQNVASNSNIESNSLQAESSVDKKEGKPAENSMLHDFRIQAAVSECVTEISLCSTLGSLDISEMEGGEIVLEIGAMEKKNCSISLDADKDLDISSVNDMVSPSTINSGINELQGQNGNEQTVSDTNDSVSIVQIDQNSSEPTTSAVQNHLVGAIEQARSPEGTPRSHATTVPQLNGTPSSDTSLRSKNGKDHKILTQTKRSHSFGKRSLSNSNTDIVGRSSTENFSKDSRIQKRHNSVGTTKTEHIDDEEPRLSSGNRLPGYMQATASARAKAHAIQSQKSSPDLLDNQLKKRHCLPFENGNQSSSPRIQRSASQTPQSVECNGTHSPLTPAERWKR